MLARSVASLDLLTGGRVELGIGAGVFWDADTRGGVRFRGSYYQVSGAKRGPAPAHRVSVWVGAYKPRMLRLTGRLADGWPSSLSYLQPGQLTEGNALIDQAAAEAGREPAAIRRLLNTGEDLAAGPDAAEWLAELAVSEGIGTFILASDDPGTIRGFAAEVAPAVRELVTATRSGTEGARRARDAGQEILGSGVQPTPDDGTRLSEQRPWDEAARPTRPAPPPTARYTRAGRAAGAELVAVHDMLRAELATVRDLIMQVHKGAIDAARARSELNQMTMRQNNWTMGAYCQSYLTGWPRSTASSTGSWTRSTARW